MKKHKEPTNRPLYRLFRNFNGEKYEAEVAEYMKRNIVLAI
jgi:hypothetical protein